MAMSVGWLIGDLLLKVLGHESRLRRRRLGGPGHHQLRRPLAQQDSGVGHRHGVMMKTLLRVLIADADAGMGPLCSSIRQKLGVGHRVYVASRDRIRVSPRHRSRIVLTAMSRWDLRCAGEAGEFAVLVGTHIGTLHIAP